MLIQQNMNYCLDSIALDESYNIVQIFQGIITRQFYQIYMNFSAAPAWSLYGKKCTVDQLNDGYQDSSPGPVYNISGAGIKTRSLFFKQGNSQRTQINQGVLNNPSPSHYKPNHPALLTHSVSFTKQIKDQEKFSENPDPGAYSAKNDYVKQTAPNFSLGSRYPSIMDNTGKNPGPGDYNNPQYLFQSTFYRKSKIGSEPRFLKSHPIKPGPGDYKIQGTLLNGKGSLTKSKKFRQIRQSPGPGDYRHNDRFDDNKRKQIGKTLSKKLQTCFNTQSNTVQAFNNYFREEEVEKTEKQIQVERRKIHSFSLGKQKREIFPGNQVPGPSDYKLQTNIIFKDKVQVGFTRSIATQRNDVVDNPGPGHYPNKELAVTQFSFYRSKSIDYLNKHSIDYVNKHPGPGRYNIDPGMGTTKLKFKNQSSGNLIGKSQRTNFISKNIAGVGDFNVGLKKSTGVTIPKADRFGKPNDNPGPGDYTLSSTISNFNLYRQKN